MEKEHQAGYIKKKKKPTHLNHSILKYLQTKDKHKS